LLKALHARRRDFSGVDTDEPVPADTWTPTRHFDRTTSCRAGFFPREGTVSGSMFSPIRKIG